MVPAPVVEGLTSPSPAPTVCLLQEYSCVGARVSPALHAKILAAPNCTVLVEGLCMLPCGSIVLETVFDAVRSEACTSECLLVGTPEVCVPAPRVQDLSVERPRRVLAAVRQPVTQGSGRNWVLMTVTMAMLMGVGIAVLLQSREGDSSVPLLG